MRLAPIVAAVLLAAGARAQTAGGISGVVVDEDGAPVARAVLIVSGPALQGERTASTDPSGVFDLPQLPPGAYSIDVHCFGYASFTQEGVAVHLASTTQVMLRMLHEAGAAAGRRPQPSAISVPVVTAAQMELIPYGREVRSFEQAALAAPGLTRLAPGIHGPGTLADETRFVVDGIDVTDPDRRVLATRLLQNFVEEVAVRTIPLAAEYGRASGALISAVTRSGGNEFHGSVFAGAIGDPRAIEGGFDLGGPLLRDRLWFYGGFAPEFVDGRGTDFQYAGKLSWRFADDHSLALSAFGDPGSNRSGASDFSLRYLGDAGGLRLEGFGGFHHSRSGADRLEAGGSGGAFLALAGHHRFKAGVEADEALGAAFAQDSWAVLDLFTVDAGVRYERQRGFDLIMPRLGLSWDFTGGGRSRAYAAYGRFGLPVPALATENAYDDVFSGGAQVQVYRDLVAGLDYTHRQLTPLQRLYDGVCASLSKPLSDNYVLQLSYTRSWWRGETPLVAEPDVIKLDAGYAYEWTARTTLSFGAAFRAIRSSGWETDLDLRGAFVYQLSSTYRLSVNLDVINALDRTVALIEPPITARLGGSLSF